MRNSSLWLRIVAVQLVIALVLAGALLFEVDRTIHAIGNDLTEHFLASAAQRSIESPRPTKPSPSDRDDPRFGAVATFMVHPHGLVQLAGPRIDDIAARPALRGTRPVFSHGPFSDFYLLPTDRSGSGILAAEDRRHPAVILDDVTSSFLRRFVLIVFLSLFLSAASTLVIIRLAMRPIRRVTSELTLIDAAKSSVRLSESPMPNDILPLVRATNVTLARLERAFDRERRFNATVTHELRTSLSTILLRAEALSPGRERSAIEEAVARATGVIDQMLELGAIESGIVSVGQFRIAGTTREIVAQFRPLLGAEGRRLTLQSLGDEETDISGSAALAAIALRNLIDNARRHSIPGGKIEVLCDCSAGVVTVSDEGPGLSMREDAGGRFVFARADGIRSRSSGLGLAIVHRAIETCGGSLTFERSAAGGTAATLTFPPAR